MAAPQVAGVASLIWAEDMSESADFVRYAVSQSANTYGYFDEYGNGLVDADYALNHYDELKKEYHESKK